MRNPKQLFSLPLFPLKKKREKEKEERIGRDGRRFDKRALSRSQEQRLAISDSYILTGVVEKSDRND